MFIGAVAFSARPAATQTHTPQASQSPSAAATRGPSDHLAAVAAALASLAKVQSAANTNLTSARSELTTLRTLASGARTHLRSVRAAHTTRPQDCAVVGASRADVTADLVRARALTNSIIGRANSVLAAIVASQPTLLRAGTELTAAQRAGATRTDISAYSTALQAAPISRSAIGATATANRTAAAKLASQVGSVDGSAGSLLALCYRQTAPHHR